MLMKIIAVFLAVLMTLFSLAVSGRQMGGPVPAEMTEQTEKKDATPTAEPAAMPTRAPDDSQDDNALPEIPLFPMG